MQRLNQLVCLSLVTALLGAGCAVEDDPIDGETDSFVDESAILDSEAELVLAFVNDEATDLGLLDYDVALNQRAAVNIIAERPFATLEQLDAVPYVGPVALEQLLDYVLAHPAPAAETIEGVDFTADQAAAVVFGVNRASLQELDVTVGLDARAARSLVASAPFANLAEIAEVYYVGASALTHLRDYSPAWQADLDAGAALAGTFDTVTFDAAAALTALAIANGATYEELTWNGIYFAGAHLIVDNRPHANLSNLAAISGIGKGTMQSLHDLATSGDWPALECNGVFADAENATMQQYAIGLENFDPYDTYAVGAWFAPECFDISTAAHAAGLRSKLIEMSGWDYVLRDFPDLLEYGDVKSGAGELTTALDWSIQSMEWHRDDRVADGDATAAAEYDALVAMHSEIRALATASPATTYSLTIHVEALECSQDAAIMVDVESGLVIAVRRGPAC